MKRRTIVLGALLWCGAAASQSVIEWTEQPGILGLGFPVPEPVDTPLPFDGFRSYNGLLTRHQDFMLNHEFIAGEVVGNSEAGRDIWAYRYSDADSITVTGLPEPAIYTQGGIHAREWQSPEVLTGIMEHLVANAGDQWLHRYLLDNMNMVLLPVLNVDGYLQTQRFPRQVYLEGSAPRDGRMRRKNMLGVDEDINTSGDRLLGVDLNRNSPPFWATNSGASSSDPGSIVHHGSGPHSEPESLAMVAAARLGPEDRLRMYTDVHSFSQVHFSVNTNNTRRNVIQRNLLGDFSSFHAQLEGGKVYIDRPSDARQGQAIGSTDEFFAVTYAVPSWTLEIEPSGTLSPDAHPSLPGCGADYGGFASNCHDGFILPESEIRRVRENLGQTFPIAYYGQAGPPSVTAVRWIDDATGAVVADAEWDVQSATQRSLFFNQVQPLQLDRSYTLWLAFDKPMRWRNDNGQIAPLPGQATRTTEVTADLLLEDVTQSPEDSSGQWLANAGGAPDGYYRYRDDAYSASFNLAGSPLAAAITGETQVTLNLSAQDMVGQLLDGDPATPADWGIVGNWVGYEDTNGVETDLGGSDDTLTFAVTSAALDDPFVITPGVSAVWFDPTHDGEGFVIEVLDNQRAVVYWFTYDKAGNQRWMIGIGQVRGNEVVFPELLESSGGIFGDAFDPAQVQFSNAGNASFVWSDCGAFRMRHNVDVRNQRQAALRLTDSTGSGCEFDTDRFSLLPFTGSWYDLEHDGEGFVISAAGPDRVVVYWFTYDDTGNQAWIVGDGSFDNGQVNIEQAFIASGGVFGDAFDPDTVSLEPWGQLQFSLGCNSGSVNYQSVLPQYGSGSQNLTRLTNLAGLDCTTD